MFQIQVVSAAPADPLASLRAQSKEIALNLSQPIAVCVGRYDTNRPAFHGCVDWHSSVHGVWALVAYTSLTGDRRYVPIIRALLTPTNVAAEERYLEANPDFEMPYGRSWFLRLAIEYGRLYKDQLLVRMGDSVAASLYSRYQRQPASPTSGAYASDSWALINLMDYYDYRGDAARLAVVKGVVRRDFASVDTPCDENLERPEFMAICTNVAWAVSRVDDKATFERWLARYFPPSAIQGPIVEAASDHENGLGFSRAWGLWPLYEATKEPAYGRAYLADFRAAYANEASWRGPYWTVSHWVAQFGMFALRPALGVEP